MLGILTIFAYSKNMASDKDPIDLSANHDTQIIVVAAVFQTLMLASFIIRMVSVRLRHQKYGIEELLLTIALVSSAHMTAL